MRCNRHPDHHKQPAEHNLQINGRDGRSSHSRHYADKSIITIPGVRGGVSKKSHPAKPQQAPTHYSSKLNRQAAAANGAVGRGAGEHGVGNKIDLQLGALSSGSTKVSGPSSAGVNGQTNDIVIQKQERDGASKYDFFSKLEMAKTAQGRMTQQSRTRLQQHARSTKPATNGVATKSHVGAHFHQHLKQKMEEREQLRQGGRVLRSQAGVVQGDVDAMAHQQVATGQMNHGMHDMQPVAPCVTKSDVCEQHPSASEQTAQKIVQQAGVLDTTRKSDTSSFQPLAAQVELTAQYCLGNATSPQRLQQGPQPGLDENSQVDIEAEDSDEEQCVQMLPAVGQNSTLPSRVGAVSNVVAAMDCSAHVLELGTNDAGADGALSALLPQHGHICAGLNLQGRQDDTPVGNQSMVQLEPGAIELNVCAEAGESTFKQEFTIHAQAAHGQEGSVAAIYAHVLPYTAPRGADAGNSKGQEYQQQSLPSQAGSPNVAGSGLECVHKALGGKRCVKQVGRSNDCNSSRGSEGLAMPHEVLEGRSMELSGVKQGTDLVELTAVQRSADHSASASGCNDAQSSDAQTSQRTNIIEAGVPLTAARHELAHHLSTPIYQEAKAAYADSKMSLGLASQQVVAGVVGGMCGGQQVAGPSGGSYNVIELRSQPAEGKEQAKGATGATLVRAIIVPSDSESDAKGAAVQALPSNVGVTQADSVTGQQGPPQNQTLAPSSVQLEGDLRQQEQHDGGLSLFDSQACKPPAIDPVKVLHSQSEPSDVPDAPQQPTSNLTGSDGVRQVLGEVRGDKVSTSQAKEAIVEVEPEQEEMGSACQPVHAQAGDSTKDAVEGIAHNSALDCTANAHQTYVPAKLSDESEGLESTADREAVPPDATLSLTLTQEASQHAHAVQQQPSLAQDNTSGEVGSLRQALTQSDASAQGGPLSNAVQRTSFDVAASHADADEKVVSLYNEPRSIKQQELEAARSEIKQAMSAQQASQRIVADCPVVESECNEAAPKSLVAVKPSSQVDIVPPSQDSLECTSQEPLADAEALPKPALTGRRTSRPRGARGRGRQRGRGRRLSQAASATAPKVQPEAPIKGVEIELAPVVRMQQQRGRGRTRGRGRRGRGRHVQPPTETHKGHLLSRYYEQISALLPKDVATSSDLTCVPAILSACVEACASLDRGATQSGGGRAPRAPGGRFSCGRGKRGRGELALDQGRGRQGRDELGGRLPDSLTSNISTDPSSFLAAGRPPVFPRQPGGLHPPLHNMGALQGRRVAQGQFSSDYSSLESKNASLSLAVDGFYGAAGDSGSAALNRLEGIAMPGSHTLALPSTLQQIQQHGVEAKLQDTVKWSSDAQCHEQPPLCNGSNGLQGESLEDGEVRHGLRGRGRRGRGLVRGASRGRRGRGRRSTFVDLSPRAGELGGQSEQLVHVVDRRLMQQVEEQLDEQGDTSDFMSDTASSDSDSWGWLLADDFTTGNKPEVSGGGAAAVTSQEGACSDMQVATPKYGTALLPKPQQGEGAVPMHLSVEPTKAAEATGLAVAQVQTNSQEAGSGAGQSSPSAGLLQLSVEQLDSALAVMLGEDKVEPVQAGRAALLPGGGMDSVSYAVKPLKPCGSGGCHHHANRYSDVVLCDQCGIGFCYHCWFRYYRELLLLHEVDTCPRCLGICSCKHCLREEKVFKKPSWADALRRGSYIHVLVHAVRAMRELFEHEKRAVTAYKAACPDKEVRKVRMEAQETFYCDVCSTTIANLFYKCESCKLEVCLGCGDDIRECLARVQPGWSADLAAEHSRAKAACEPTPVLPTPGPSPGVAGAPQAPTQAATVEGANTCGLAHDQSIGTGAAMASNTQAATAQLVPKQVDAAEANPAAAPSAAIPPPTMPPQKRKLRITPQQIGPPAGSTHSPSLPPPTQAKVPCCPMPWCNYAALRMCALRRTQQRKLVSQTIRHVEALLEHAQTKGESLSGWRLAWQGLHQMNDALVDGMSGEVQRVLALRQVVRRARVGMAEIQRQQAELVGASFAGEEVDVLGAKDRALASNGKLSWPVWEFDATGINSGDKPPPGLADTMLYDITGKIPHVKADDLGRIYPKPLKPRDLAKEALKLANKQELRITTALPTIKPLPTAARFDTQVIGLKKPCASSLHAPAPPLKSTKRKAPAPKHAEEVAAHSAPQQASKSRRSRSRVVREPEGGREEVGGNDKSDVAAQWALKRKRDARRDSGRERGRVPTPVDGVTEQVQRRQRPLSTKRMHHLRPVRMWRISHLHGLPHPVHVSTLVEDARVRMSINCNPQPTENMRPVYVHYTSNVCTQSTTPAPTPAQPKVESPAIVDVPKPKPPQKKPPPPPTMSISNSETEARPLAQLGGGADASKGQGADASERSSEDAQPLAALQAAGTEAGAAGIQAGVETAEAEAAGADIVKAALEMPAETKLAGAKADKVGAEVAKTEGAGAQAVKVGVECSAEERCDQDAQQGMPSSVLDVVNRVECRGGFEGDAPTLEGLQERGTGGEKESPLAMAGALHNMAKTSTCQIQSPKVGTAEAAALEERGPSLSVFDTADVAGLPAAQAGAESCQAKPSQETDHGVAKLTVSSVVDAATDAAADCTPDDIRDEIVVLDGDSDDAEVPRSLQNAAQMNYKGDVVAVAPTSITFAGSALDRMEGVTMATLKTAPPIASGLSAGRPPLSTPLSGGRPALSASRALSRVPASDTPLPQTPKESNMNQGAGRSEALAVQQASFQRSSAIEVGAGAYKSVQDPWMGGSDEHVHKKRKMQHTQGALKATAALQPTPPPAVSALVVQGGTSALLANTLQPGNTAAESPWRTHTSKAQDQVVHEHSLPSERRASVACAWPLPSARNAIVVDSPSNMHQLVQPLSEYAPQTAHGATHASGREHAPPGLELHVPSASGAAANQVNAEQPVRGKPHVNGDTARGEQQAGCAAQSGGVKPAIHAAPGPVMSTQAEEIVRRLNAAKPVMTASQACQATCQSQELDRSQPHPSSLLREQAATKQLHTSPATDTSNAMQTAFQHVSSVGQETPLRQVNNAARLGLAVYPSAPASLQSTHYLPVPCSKVSPHLAMPCCAAPCITAQASHKSNAHAMPDAQAAHSAQQAVYGKQFAIFKDGACEQSPHTRNIGIQPGDNEVFKVGVARLNSEPVQGVKAQVYTLSPESSLPTASPTITLSNYGSPTTDVAYVEQPAPAQFFSGYVAPTPIGQHRGHANTVHGAQVVNVGQLHVADANYGGTHMHSQPHVHGVIMPQSQLQQQQATAHLPFLGNLRAYDSPAWSGPYAARHSTATTPASSYSQSPHVGYQEGSTVFVAAPSKLAAHAPGLVQVLPAHSAHQDFYQPPHLPLGHLLGSNQGTTHVATYPGIRLGSTNNGGVYLQEQQAVPVDLERLRGGAPSPANSQQQTTEGTLGGGQTSSMTKASDQGAALVSGAGASHVEPYVGSALNEGSTGAGGGDVVDRGSAGADLDKSGAAMKLQQVDTANGTFAACDGGPAAPGSNSKQLASQVLAGMQAEDACGNLGVASAYQEAPLCHNVDACGADLQAEQSMEQQSEVGRRRKRASSPFRQNIFKELLRLTQGQEMIMDGQKRRRQQVDRYQPQTPGCSTPINEFEEASVERARPSSRHGDRSTPVTRQPRGAPDKPPRQRVQRQAARRQRQRMYLQASGDSEVGDYSDEPHGGRKRKPVTQPAKPPAAMQVQAEAMKVEDAGVAPARRRRRRTKAELRQKVLSRLLHESGFARERRSATMHALSTQTKLVTLSPHFHAREKARPELYVRAALRDQADGAQDFILAVEAQAVRSDPHLFQRMWEHWEASEPVILRGVVPGMSWDPQVMARALHERGGLAKLKTEVIESDQFISVLNCLTEQWVQLRQTHFFKHYQQMGLHGAAIARQQCVAKFAPMPPPQPTFLGAQRAEREALDKLDKAGAGEDAAAADISARPAPGEVGAAAQSGSAAAEFAANDNAIGETGVCAQKAVGQARSNGAGEVAAAVEGFGGGTVDAVSASFQKQQSQQRGGADAQGAGDPGATECEVLTAKKGGGVKVGDKSSHGDGKDAEVVSGRDGQTAIDICNAGRCTLKLDIDRGGAVHCSIELHSNESEPTQPRSLRNNRQAKQAKEAVAVPKVQAKPPRPPPRRARIPPPPPIPSHFPGVSGTLETLLKLKDWPSESDFKGRLKRHAQDFLQLQKQTGFLSASGLEDAPLNVCALPDPTKFNATDLGPKTYISFGRHEEVLGGTGNPATKLHIDMCDAINLCVHVQYRPGEEGSSLEYAAQPAAIWDIFRQQDLAKLHDFVEKYAHEFEHEGKAVGAPNAALVVDPYAPPHAFFLDTAMLQRLKKETGVVPWRFYQRYGEAVLVPASCPHQVRNILPNIKVAADFTSPANTALVARIGDFQRYWRPQGVWPESMWNAAERLNADKLQFKTMLFLLFLRAGEDGLLTKEGFKYRGVKHDNKGTKPAARRRVAQSRAPKDGVGAQS